MEVLILTNQYTYLLREILNSGVTSSIAFKPKITRPLHPSPIFPVTVLLVKLSLVIVLLLRNSCKKQLLCMFPLLASASVYIVCPTIVNLHRSCLNLHDAALLPQLVSGWLHPFHILLILQCLFQKSFHLIPLIYTGNSPLVVLIFDLQKL